MTYSYRSIKVSYDNLSELCKFINSLQATRIISISQCLPDCTDTKLWTRIYYEYLVN